MIQDPVTEFCPCKLKRPLATYRIGSDTIESLSPKASIGMSIRIPRDLPQGKHPAVVAPGTATCQRLMCRLLGRS